MILYYSVITPTVPPAWPYPDLNKRQEPGMELATRNSLSFDHDNLVYDEFYSRYYAET